MRLDDDSLAKAVVEAFNGLPAPEAARLEGLGRRLLRQASSTSAPRRPRARFWWMFAGLVATGAAAAWWGGAYWSDVVSRSKSPPSPPAAVETIDREHEQRKTDQHADAPPENASPESETSSQTIYRREVY